MKIKTQSPFGAVNISVKNEVLSIKADTDLAAFWGQGYATARLRLWQMDLTRRVAGGELCEILGSGARSTDVFQRKLGLRALAKKEVDRCQNVREQTGEEELQSQHVKAYVAGANAALAKMKLMPFECTLLRYRPKPFTQEDVYLVANLKYFINSAWQYELFHTNMLKRINARQADQVFKTFTEEGGQRSPLSYKDEHERSLEAEQALQDGLEGLRMLGLSSPDTGSNVFAVSGQHSANGKPLLASDPHMGQVNPGYCLMCHLQTDEGLDVFGANFPGAPGIVVGRNKTSSWGMVGIMADNQDLFHAEIDWDKNLVKTKGGQWIPLQKIEHTLTIKGQKDAHIKTYAIENGRLIQTGEKHGIFLRWPALDAPLGDIVLYKTAKCSNWTEFRASLSELYNAPMMVGYADIHGDIGLQAVGLFPKRDGDSAKENLGSLLQSLEHPASPWHGYEHYDALPSLHNPPEGYVAYANQYSSALFDWRCSISNRWHPPTRVQRIKTLIEQKEKLTAQDMMAIQDDKVDGFAQKELPFLLSLLEEKTPLDDWHGDTTEVERNMLFERWIYALAHDICVPAIRSKMFALYTDFWPTFRWCIMEILRHHLRDWLKGEQKLKLEENYQAVMAQLVKSAYDKANVKGVEVPPTVLQHSIKQPALMRHLLTGVAPYQGGNRETIHATRQNTDFLTSSQVDFKQKKQNPFSFGPAFKLVSEFGAEHAAVHYMVNSPASGRPFAMSLKANTKRWQMRRRQIWRFL